MTRFAQNTDRTRSSKADCSREQLVMAGVLIAETSCEQRNDFLDRALVAPTVSTRDAAFFVPSKAQT